MKKFILSDVCPHEVSLVSEGAIQKKFIIYKSKNDKSEFKKGEFKAMKIEEAIELGLVDEKEAERLLKKDEKPADSNVMKELLASVMKMIGKVQKAEDKPAEKMTEEEKKKLADEAKKKEDEVSKKLDDLTKAVEGNKKAQELLVKLSTCQDPKEFLKVLAEAKELTKVAPENEDVNTKVVKALDTITKRLETIELASKGLKGQDNIEKKKSSWGGAFK